MPKGKRTHDFLDVGKRKSRKAAAVCLMCGSRLFRGVTCPVCDDDLLDLFVLCVFSGEVKISAAEAVSLGVDLSTIRCGLHVDIA